MEKIDERTYKFALRIIKLGASLTTQIKVGMYWDAKYLRSGTSIGANVEEAYGAASSKRDFANKLCTFALKEASETHLLVSSDSR